MRLKYIETNFNWYKNSAMGGKWEVLVSMGFGKGTFIVARTSEELMSLIKAKKLKRNTPYIIHGGRSPEMYFQPNPTK